MKMNENGSNNNISKYWLLNNIKYLHYLTEKKNSGAAMIMPF